MDRNINCNSNFTQKKHVALRKESVDRNFFVVSPSPLGCGSLSARRAWIEIHNDYNSAQTTLVALRKESVDRNAAWTGVLRDMHHASLSARRAWIEILKQRVDFEEEPRRSPQGERG